ncbi:MAG: hypothetical protein QOJ62_2478 [Actinomycetota bacterium]|jgi:hypothetical protein|nr:hypothetical protein [Actinomycetota bacterium]
MANTSSNTPGTGRRRGKAAGKPRLNRKERKAARAGQPRRSAQIREVFKLTRQRDKRLLPIMALAFVVTLGVFALAGYFAGGLIMFIVFGVIAGALMAFIVFGKRARNSMYGEIEGQPGAAAAIVDSMKGDWRLTANVAATRQMDVVHRVVGKPGVILIGEGSIERLQPLIADQQKRVQRVAAGTPVQVIIVGNEAGQVPLGKLERKMTRLPRTFKGPTVDQIEGRMRAIGGLNIPIPKGPMPKGARLPKGVNPPR